MQPAEEGGEDGGSTSLCRLTLRFLNLQDIHQGAGRVYELAEVLIS